MLIRLEIRGDMNDETVLVSATKSYKIRQHDSSNTILITSLNNKQKYEDNDVDMEDVNESIYSAVSCIYTLEQQPPRLNKLYQILYQRPYS